MTIHWVAIVATSTISAMTGVEKADHWEGENAESVLE
jgi:hypothetical protein